MNTLRALVVAALGLSLPVAPLVAQRPDPRLRPWERVRVTAPAVGLDRSREDFLPVRGDSVVFASVETRVFESYRKTDTIPLTVPLDDVTRLEARRSNRMLLGLVSALAAFVGSRAGYSRGQEREVCSEPPAPDVIGLCSRDQSEKVSYGLISFAGGAVLGSALGYLVSPGQWEPVDLERLRPVVAALSDRGVGLGAPVSF